MLVTVAFSSVVEQSKPFVFFRCFVALALKIQEKEKEKNLQRSKVVALPSHKIDLKKNKNKLIIDTLFHFIITYLDQTFVCAK